MFVCSRRRRAEARPADLIEAGLARFCTHGFAATRLEDVAKAAGVAKGTMYLYFPSKEALFEAIIRQTMVPMVEQVEQEMAQVTGTAAQRLAALIRIHWDSAKTPRWAGVPKLVIAEIGNFPDLGKVYHDEVVVRWLRLYTEIIDAGIAAGEFRPMEVRSCAHMAVSPMLMSLLWQHSFKPCQGCGSELDPEALIDSHITTFLRGIAAGGHP